MAVITASELATRVDALASIAALRTALGDGFADPLYLVGGAVRDLLIGRDPLDLDLAIEGPIENLVERLGAGAESYSRFATATVRTDGWRYDIAQTRAESYRQPGALPNVRPATINEDLGRRDFTVNAIAFGLAGPLAGELVAADGALADLEAGRLAVLHERSFEDDPTRIWRLARYAARLGFGIVPQTRELARAAIADRALETVSGARIGAELRLALGEPDPLAALKQAGELGLGWSIDQHLAERALAELPADGRADLLTLAIAIYPSTLVVHESATRALLDRLEFSAQERELVVQTATSAQALGERARDAVGGAAIADAIGKAGVETVAFANALLPLAQLQRWLRDLRHRELQITGDDLIAAGREPGPALGHALKAARDAMLDDQAPDRESQLSVALATAR